MRVDIRVIPHKDQRYDTVGDWWYTHSNDTLWIRVSDMGNKDYQNLVAIHEYVEAILCLDRDIKEDDVTKFDIIFEANRAHGVTGFTGEPGDHPDAPYKKEHFFATSIERLVSAELGIDWNNYDKIVESL